MSRLTKLLVIENSSGMSGSAVSLCNLVANLDPEEFLPSVIFSRPEQLKYFRSRFDTPVEAEVVRCRSHTKTTAIAQPIATFARRVHPSLARAVYGVCSLLDVVVVFAPYVFQMARIARKKQIDLIHQNNGFDFAAVFLALLVRKPLLAYQRGAEWNSALVRYLAKFVDVYVANSEQTLRDLREIGVPQEKVVVITPPVDLGQYDYRLDCTRQREEFAIADPDLCFAILGTLLEWKGQHVFLLAAQRVLQSIPGARAFLIGKVPTGSDPDYERRLRDMADSLGIRDRVVFTGFREDMPQMIQTQRVIVHASITPEPFGRVIIESMAMAKPVVASKAGGPLEIIDDGVNGFLVPPGDDAALADRIGLLLTNPQLAATMGHAARLKTQRCYTIDQHVKAVSRVYRDLLAHAGPPVRTLERDERTSKPL